MCTWATLRLLGVPTLPTSLRPSAIRGLQSGSEMSGDRYPKHTLMVAHLVPFNSLSLNENTLQEFDLLSLQRLFIEEVGRVMPNMRKHSVSAAGWAISAAWWAVRGRQHAHRR